MKAIALVLLTLFLGKGCSDEQKNNISKAVIEYKANSRGFYQKISIQNKKLYVIRDRNSSEKQQEKDISKQDWNELVKYFEKIELDSLSTYKDPTQKRFYDGAAIADLKVFYKEKEYRTLSFDHGHPPFEIEDLVNKIIELGSEKK